MNLYTLCNVENTIIAGIVATRFVIRQFGSGMSESTWLAKGTVWWKDYYTGTSYKDNWEAMLSMPHATHCLQVIASRDQLQPMLWRVHKKEGELYKEFSDVADINSGMAQFIGHELCVYCMYIGDDGRLPRIQAAPQHFVGQLKPYKGVCLCQAVEKSSRRRPFLWQQVTSGQYAKRCFQCSCRRRWWNPDPDKHRWVPVGDVATWRMLLRYNGEPARQLCLCEGAIRLLGPMVKRGNFVFYPPFTPAY
jgi:hypothetical protein